MLKYREIAISKHNLEITRIFNRCIWCYFVFYVCGTGKFETLFLNGNEAIFQFTEDTLVADIHNKD